MIKSKRFFAILGAATFATSLSLPALAGSAKDDAIEACRLIPQCKVAEIVGDCKGDEKCIVDSTEKYTKNYGKKVNKTGDKVKKGIKNIFKKKKKKR